MQSSRFKITENMINKVNILANLTWTLATDTDFGQSRTSGGVSWVDNSTPEAASQVLALKIDLDANDEVDVDFYEFTNLLGEDVTCILGYQFFIKASNDPDNDEGDEPVLEVSPSVSDPLDWFLDGTVTIKSPGYFSMAQSEAVSIDTSSKNLHLKNSGTGVCNVTLNVVLGE